MAHIVISEFMDPPAVARLQAAHTVVYDRALVDQPEALRAACAQADVLIVRNRTQVRGELVAALGRCKVVGRLGVGLDNIDVAACEARGMRVIPASGANALSVAEYVVGTAMVLLRSAYASSAAVAAGQWPRPALSQGREIAGKTLGLVGFGSIGRLTAKLAQGLGMRVVAHDPVVPAADPVWAATGVAPASLDELLAQSDVVSLHIPLTPATRNLINAARVARMKKGAVLVNSARGGVVDEAAVAASLRAGHLGGAAIDVFDAEPLPAGSPWVDCPRVILTPHIAGVTAESNERVSDLIADKVLEALAS